MIDFCDFQSKYKDIEFSIYYGNVKEYDTADGPGVRVALYVSGCPHACDGCHNKESWDYKFGNIFNIERLYDLYQILSKPYCSGLSILGGEPLDPKNKNDVFTIIEILKEEIPNLNIWVWTGYTWEYLLESNILPKQFNTIIDVLVDGKFELDNRDITLKYRGSPNQRVIDVKQSILKNEVITLV